MKLLFGTLISLMITFISLGQQQYSYSFSGEIDSSFVEQLEADVMVLEGVSAAKGKYKVEKGMGEIIVFTEQDSERKDPYVFSPAEIKAIFKKYKLTPGRFVELKSTK